MSTLNVDTLQDKAGAFEHARLVQVVNTETGALATGTTNAVADDSIPQNSEGTEFMTLAITPTHASNKLLIEVVGNFAINASDNLIMALFQDTTANALAAVQWFTSGSNHSQQINLNHFMAAGTTSSTTFKIRAGETGSNTVTFNGAGGSRIFGGNGCSSITISEIRV
jgi:hypothetical protein